MRMGSHQLKHFLDRYPVEVQEIFQGVRECVFSAVPSAWEKPKMDGMAYYLAEDSTPLQGMICHALPKADRVEIGFIFGAFLPDPAGLLHGTQKAKRFAVIREYDRVDWAALEALMRASAEVDPHEFY